MSHGLSKYTHVLICMFLSFHTIETNTSLRLCLPEVQTCQSSPFGKSSVLYQNNNAGEFVVSSEPAEILRGTNVNFSKNVLLFDSQDLAVTESHICTTTILVLCQTDWKVRLQQDGIIASVDFETRM